MSSLFKLVRARLYCAEQRYGTQRNMDLLAYEIAWGTLLAALSSFNAVFVLRLGGSNAMVSALTATPALIAALSMIPAAIFSTIMNFAAFLLPMIGVGLANLLSIRTVLYIGGGLRLLGALLFHISRVRVEEGAMA